MRNWPYVDWWSVGPILCVSIVFLFLICTSESVLFVQISNIIVMFEEWSSTVMLLLCEDYHSFVRTKWTRMDTFMFVMICLVHAVMWEEDEEKISAALTVISYCCCQRVFMWTHARRCTADCRASTHIELTCDPLNDLWWRINGRTDVRINMRRGVHSEQ